MVLEFQSILPPATVKFRANAAFNYNELLDKKDSIQ